MVKNKNKIKIKTKTLQMMLDRSKKQFQTRLNPIKS